MEIDTSRVLTDEHREALDRLIAGGITKEEFKKIFQQLPDWAQGLSEGQHERIFQLESAGDVEGAAALGVSEAFAVWVTKTTISGRIHGRLVGLDNLPDQMAELERIGQIEMGSEVAYVENSLVDAFPLPTHEIVRLYKSALNTKYELLEKELNLQRRKRERNDSLGNKFEYELSDREKLLAQICPLFNSSTLQIQQAVWSKLVNFTRNQWALFLIETNPARKKYSSIGDAVKGIIRPLAKTIEEISGLSNIRGTSLVEGSAQYSKDLKKVHEIISFLKAHAVLAKTNLLPLTKT